MARLDLRNTAPVLDPTRSIQEGGRPAEMGNKSDSEVAGLLAGESVATNAASLHASFNRQE
jgi:hypothetical protein